MSDIEKLGGAERFYLVSSMQLVEVCDATATGNGTWTMSGYAAVFDQQTTALDNGFEKLTVEIAPEAFDNVLATQPLNRPEGVVHFNFGHDMNTAVAATDVPLGQPGSLELRTDSHGLRFFARVAADDPDAIRLASKMRTGVVKQASFAFVAKTNEFTYTEDEQAGTFEANRRILEIQSLHDVCACPQGLFAQTVSGLQQYAKQLGSPDIGGLQRRPALGGASVVSSQEGAAATRPQIDMARLAAMRDRHRPIVARPFER